MITGDTKSKKNAFGTEQPLPLFIRSLVGLDHQAAQQAFSKYLQGITYNEKQIRFIEMMIKHLTQRGVLEVSQLYEPPFNQVYYEGIDADEIFAVVDAFNQSAVA